VSIGQWLSSAERKRIKARPDSALSRQFGVARAAFRLVVSQMLICDPGEVGIDELPDSRLVVTGLRDGRPLAVDIGQAGVWIVIVASAAQVGVGLVNPLERNASGALLPSPPAGATESPDDLLERAFRISIDRAQRCEFAARPGAMTAAPEAVWHSLKLPMPGAIRAAVTTQQPITRVEAFGWQS
jgi:hypothetical protein